MLRRPAIDPEFVPSSTAHRLGLLAVALLSIGCPVASATATVLLNDVRPWSGSTGVGRLFPSQVTLFNPGASSVALGGWQLRGVGDTTLVLGLPAWTIPPRGYLIMNLGSGPEDADFVDDSTAVHSDSTFAGTLRREAGEIGLYQGGALRDFVAWGQGGSSFGAVYSDAIAAGQWPSAGYVDLTEARTIGHIARIPSGYDTQSPLDWQQTNWAYRETHITHNDIQIRPPDGALVPVADTLLWRSVHGASGYRVQVTSDSLFDSLWVNVATVDTMLVSPVLPDSFHFFWRVIPDVPGGPYPASVWSFSEALPGTSPVTPASLPRRARALAVVRGVRALAMPNPQAAVPQRYQHKDSPMLCDWNLIEEMNPKVELKKKVLRPGCLEAVTKVGQAGPWNVAHPDNDKGKHIKGCNHCNMYCVRASFQMVNEKYGGTLTQDEISYQIWKGAHPGPEGDLGHGMGGPVERWLEVFRWAMDGNAGVKEIRPLDANTPAAVAAEITAGRPVVIGINTRIGRWTPFNTESHAVVFDGHTSEVRKVLQAVPNPIPPGGFQWVEVPVTFHFFHFTDPFPQDPGTGWYELGNLRGEVAVTVPANVTGRKGSNLIVAANNAPKDSDSDGIVDFEEGLKQDGTLDADRRNFASRSDKADTDGDAVNDLQEVRSYVFHRRDHPTHPNDAPPANQHPDVTQRLDFPDVDGDGKRAEQDADSDGDIWEDGAEDCNRNGNSPETPPVPPCNPGRAERCVYLANAPGPPPRVWNCIRPLGRAPRQGVAEFSLPGSTGRVVDLDVRVRVTHPHPADLTLELISPLGTTVELSSGNGSSPPGYIGTVFDDEANDPIASGLPPFAGSFNPEQPLYHFDGQGSSGSWRIRITNQSTTDDAIVDSLCLGIVGGESVPPGGGGGGPSRLPTLSATIAPERFEVERLFPNPTRGSIGVEISLSSAATIRLRMLDLMGREVAILASGRYPAGRHLVHFHAGERPLRAGIFFIVLETPLGERHRTLAVLK